MTNSKDMVECLRKIPTEKLHEAHVDLYFHWHKDSTERSPMNVFSPRSDPEAGPESFLPHHPHVAMKKGTTLLCLYLISNLFWQVSTSQLFPPIRILYIPIPPPRP